MCLGVGDFFFLLSVETFYSDAQLFIKPHKDQQWSTLSVVNLLTDIFDCYLYAGDT